MHSAFCKDAHRLRIWERSWWNRCWGCSEILKQVESKVHPVIAAVGHWLVRVMNHVAGSARDSRISRVSHWYASQGNLGEHRRFKQIYLYYYGCIYHLWDSAGVTPHRADWCAQRITVCMYCTMFLTNPIARATRRSHDSEFVYPTSERVYNYPSAHPFI